jgi:hypothetical protein
MKRFHRNWFPISGEGAKPQKRNPRVRLMGTLLSGSSPDDVGSRQRNSAKSLNRLRGRQGDNNHCGIGASASC